MSSPPTQQKPVDPAERDDLGEDSDDYDAEFDVWLLQISLS